VPVEVDAEGLSVADGLSKAPHFRLAFATPSHQQPLGHVMSLSRRLALLRAVEDAERAGALSPLVADPLRSALRQIPLEQAIELINDASSILGGAESLLGPAQELLEGFLR